MEDADAWAVPTPQVRAGIVSARSAAIGRRTPQDSPVIKRLVRSVGRKWPEDSQFLKGVIRCQVEMEQVQAEWAR